LKEKNNLKPQGTLVFSLATEAQLSVNPPVSLHKADDFFIHYYQKNPPVTASKQNSI